MPDAAKILDTAPAEAQRALRTLEAAAAGQATLIPADAGPGRRSWPRGALVGLARWTDFALLAGLYWAAAAAISAQGFWDLSIGEAAPWIAAPFVGAWLLNGLGAYGFRPHERTAEHAVTVAAGGLFAALAAALLGWIAPIHGELVLAAGVAATGVLVAAHLGWRALFRSLSRSGQFAHNVVIVGATKNAQRLIEMNARSGEINVMGVFDDRAGSGRTPDVIGGSPVLGRLDDLLTWQHLPRADCIIITVTSQAAERTASLIERLRPLPNKVALFLDLETFRPESSNLAQIADLPMAYVSGRPDEAGPLLAKRIQDIVLASIALVAFAPVMAVIALLVRLDSPGPILFRQKRHGFNNRIIEVLKFRSMRPEECPGPTRQVVAGDPRVTRIGRFLRKTSLDELPQILNVLTGEMSIVGPRPHATDMKTGEVESARLVADYAHRCRVKPGITGWAQIHGSRGPVHTAEEVERRVRLDIEYIERRTLWLDLWIILMTVPCLLGDTANTR